MNHEQLVELLQDSILNHIDLDSGGYSPPLDRQVGLIVHELRPALSAALHESIMRGELVIANLVEPAINYARVHRWIDAQLGPPPET